MLSEACVAELNKEYDILRERRGDEYGRFYGLLTATMEYIERVLDGSDSYDDEDIGYDTEDKFLFADLGVEGATQAEDWVEDFIYQVLDEVYECDTMEQFRAKFTANCSLAWLYFWDVKFWDEYYPPMIYLMKANEERMACEWNLSERFRDSRPLPQWFLDEIKEYDE
jgi:hypothetical protein